MNLDWKSFQKDGYPKKNKKVLIYFKTPKDVFDKSKGYYEHIAESELTYVDGDKVWKSDFYKYSGLFMIAWTYFEYPELE